MKKRVYGLMVCGLVLVAIWLWPPGTLLVPDCKLDGQFDDWRGRACLDDAQGDGRSGHDFKRISWATNENDSRLYFMVERYVPDSLHQGLDCRLFFDINGNGSYKDQVDKYAEISYQPGEARGEVIVRLYSMAGELRGTYRGMWGEGINAGASRFEFAIPMKDLRVYPAQLIRFYMADITGQFDRLPDHGDNQWAPFPVVFQSRLVIALCCLIWLAITIFFYKYRIWVFYYIWGAIGLCCLLILLFHGSLAEYRLEQYTSLILHYILGWLNITTYVFDRSPGTLLVLITMDTSWTTISIDIENSGLLEMAIIFGLIVFYPVYSWGKRIWAALAGTICVYIINLFRLIIVIFVIHKGGREMSFIAHTLIGRLIFFVLVVALYWQFITRPSLKIIKENVRDD